MSTRIPIGQILRILFTIGVMVAVVWIAGEKWRGHGSREPAPAPAVLGHGGILADHSVEAGHLRPVTFSASLAAAPRPGTLERTLDVYYGRRAFSGAPPFIPHAVDPGIARDMDCNVCHEKGGFVEKFNAYTPLTPHPQFENCLQCHVEKHHDGLFRDLDWVSVSPPKIKRAVIPGGPPPLPHPLRMHESCLACHAGPAAPLAIRTPHPERTYCLQCHVPREAEGIFERMVAEGSASTLTTESSPE